MHILVNGERVKVLVPSTGEVVDGIVRVSALAEYHQQGSTIAEIEFPLLHEQSDE